MPPIPSSATNQTNHRSPVAVAAFPSHPSQVKAFLANVVDSTEIAEIDLQVGDLDLYVLRRVEQKAPPPAPAPSPAPMAAPPASTSKGGGSQQEAPSRTAGGGEESTAGAGESRELVLTVLTSETVGTLRRGRYVAVTHPLAHSLGGGTRKNAREAAK